MSDKENIFTYIGDPRDDLSGPSSMTVYGLEFKKGEPALVEDQNIARKLAGHSHFRHGDEEVEVTGREDDDLVGLNTEQLKAVADAEGVEYDSKARKGDILEAIREARTNG